LRFGVGIHLAAKSSTVAGAFSRILGKDIGGNEFNQNYRFDLGTGEIALLTDGKSRNSWGVWSNKGDRMIYTSTRRTGKDNDFYIIDPKNTQSDKRTAPIGDGNETRKTLTQITSRASIWCYLASQ
jgi:hypothetical protein